MQEQPNSSENQAPTAKGAPEIQVPKPLYSPKEQNEAEANLEKVAEEMSGFERSTLRWTKATFGIVTATGLFICLQWCEMRSGGEDTRKIAEATKKQAAASVQQVSNFAALAIAAKSQSDDTVALAQAAKDQVTKMEALGAATIAQNQVLANQLTTMRNGQTVQERPWIKVGHGISAPLTFDVAGRIGSPMAMMTIQDTIENVGQTIALNVLSWEDIIPIDADMNPRAAVARQNEWCDFNRNSDQTRQLGSVLFPHDPLIQQSSVGVPAARMQEAIRQSKFEGRVGFVLVGCVVYRSSFEPPNIPNHQTRFMYDLSVPQEGGLYFQPLVTPHGVASNLRLIRTPMGIKAD